MWQNMKHCNCFLCLVTRITTLFFTSTSITLPFSSGMLLQTWVYPFLHLLLFHFKEKNMGLQLAILS